ncbi:MAG: hypothetical protein KF729_16755 [Sandaracinaceae bacterium]|nr:hypothetical protein [Sandaracinaceae bacterium]
MSELPPHLAGGPSRPWIPITAAAAVGILGLTGLALWLGRTVPGTEGLAVELRDRGRIAVIGADELLRIEAEGAELMPAREVPGLVEALAGRDEEALDAALARAGVAGLLVDGRAGADRSEGATLEQRLRAYATTHSLRGVYLTPAAALYVRRGAVYGLEPAMGDVLARAARQIVGGSSTPLVRAFPEPLRRGRNVEVMVLLEQGDRPRLWRSARGGSIARALVTAASVARQRWTERQQAMGGELDERLPRMTVRVYLLEEDGTLGDVSAPFVERVITEDHGVAFEHRGSWHYLLPRATAERGEGSAMRAYAELFDDAGLPADSLGRDELRAYRMVAREVGTSPPTASAPAPGEEQGPDALLAPFGDLDELR